MPSTWLAAGLGALAAVLLAVGLVVYLRRRQSLEYLLRKIAWSSSRTW
jgi:sensor c-di-GMP phosphodiesterase-like protein